MMCFACNVSAQGFLDDMLNSSKESFTQTVNDFKTWNGGRAVKIKLTGTLEENVVMTVGETGRKETISSLPYEFKVTKKDLPLKLSFTTKKGGKYATINVPKKATDNIGHVYLLKPDQQYFYANNGIPQQQVQQPVCLLLPTARTPMKVLVPYQLPSEPLIPALAVSALISQSIWL